MGGAGAGEPEQGQSRRGDGEFLDCPGRGVQEAERGRCAGVGPLNPARDSRCLREQGAPQEGWTGEKGVERAAGDLPQLAGQSGSAESTCSWASTVSATPSSSAALLGACRYRIIGSRSRARARRRMDSASPPSRSMISSAVASTASRLILPPRPAAGPPSARAVGVVMTRTPSPPGERMQVTTIRY